MAKIPGLRRKGHGYALNKRIPKDVQSHYQVTQLSASFRKMERNAAERQALETLAKWESEFEDLRAWTPSQIDKARQIVRLGGLFNGDAANLNLSDLRRIACDLDWELPRTDEGLDEIESQMWEQASQEEHQRLRLKVFLATKLDNYWDWFQKQKDAQKEFGVDVPVRLPTPSRVDALKGFQTVNGPNRTLGTAFEAWRQRIGPSPNTYAEYHPRIRRFEDIFGTIDIKTINREMVSEYLETIRLIPAHLGNADTKLPLQKIVEKFDGQEVPRLTENSVSKHLETIKQMLNWAFQNGWIESNPAADMKIEKPKSKLKRLPFSKEELVKIINYCSKWDDHRFWMPLFSLASGARINEIAQLRKKDFHNEEGVLYFSINEEDGKRVKNPSSVRKVPVHPSLVDAGLLEYLKSIQGDDIFPKLNADSKGNYSGNYSKLFGRHLRQNIGIEEKGKVFHSFRYTFIQLARAQGVPEEWRKAIVGHSSGDVHATYSAGDYLNAKFEYIKTIQFGFEFPKKTYR